MLGMTGFTFRSLTMDGEYVYACPDTDNTSNYLEYSKAECNSTTGCGDYDCVYF